MKIVLWCKKAGLRFRPPLNQVDMADHVRNRLDENKVKSALTQGEVVLQEWLRAIGKI